MRCSDHVVGGQPEDDASRRQRLFADGSAGCEYAEVVWGREEVISPSSAGDHLRNERLKHLCVELERRRYADWQYPRG